MTHANHTHTMYRLQQPPPPPPPVVVVVVVVVELEWRLESGDGIFDGLLIYFFKFDIPQFRAWPWAESSGRRSENVARHFFNKVPIGKKK